ncbi:MAG TPA: DNA helicase RecG, partial [Deinococcales bacterium]|nr:DNA helicase RecG [Deinococcales bacterium]
MPTVDELRERLTRPLQRELDMGCQDRVVTAGLEALVNNVARPFPKVRELLRGYREMDVPTREARVRAALESLQPAARPEPNRVRAPQPARPGRAAPPVEPGLPARPAGGVQLNGASELSKLSLGPGGARKLSALGLHAVRDLWHY